MDQITDNGNATFWVNFEQKVLGLCEEVGSLALEEQMRAAHILDKSVIQLLSDIKLRLSAVEVKTEPTNCLDQSENTPVMPRKRGRPRKTPLPSVPTPVAKSKSSTTKRKHKAKVNSHDDEDEDYDFHDDEDNDDDYQDSLPAFDLGTVKLELVTVEAMSSPTTTRRGRQSKKRHIFDPSEVEFETSKRSDVIITSASGPRKKRPIVVKDAPDVATLDISNSKVTPAKEGTEANSLPSQSKLTKRRGRPPKLTEASDEPPSSIQESTVESSAANGVENGTSSLEAVKCEVDQQSNDDLSDTRAEETQNEDDTTEIDVREFGISETLEGTTAPASAKKVATSKKAKVAGAPPRKRGRPISDNHTVVEMTETLRLKPGIVRRGRPRMSDYETSETKTVLKVMRQCELCEKKFSSNTALRNHQAMHNPDSKIPCDDCGKSFFTRTGLYTHRRKYHIEDANLFKCDRCVFTSRSEESLQYHYKMRHDENRPKNFICHLCGKAFHKSLTLENHVQGVHIRDKKYQCDECEFVTHFEGCLVSHKRARHNPNRQRYRCDLCESLLATKSEYRLHMDRHAGIKRFNCPQPGCSAAFVSKSQLATHRRCKHESKKYECPVCLKKFSDKHKVSRHIIVHTGEKSFRCPFCPYKCNVQANLRKHCKNVHQQTYPPHTHLKVNERMGVKDQSDPVPDPTPPDLTDQDMAAKELPVAKHLIAMAMNEVEVEGGGGDEQGVYKLDMAADISQSVVTTSSLAYTTMQPVSQANPSNFPVLTQLTRMSPNASSVEAVSHASLLATMSGGTVSVGENQEGGAVAVEYVQHDGSPATFTQLKTSHQTMENAEIVKVVSQHLADQGGYSTAIMDTDGVATHVREHIVTGGIPTRVGDHVVMLRPDEAVMTAGEEEGTHQLILPQMSEDDLVLVVETEYS